MWKVLGEEWLGKTESSGMGGGFLLIDCHLMTMLCKYERCLIISVIAFWQKDKEEALWFRDMDADVHFVGVH